VSSAQKRRFPKQNRLSRQGTGLATCEGVDNPESDQTSQSSIESARPVQDEWGFYDPEQAGLEAVMRRLTANRDENNNGAADDTSAYDSAPHR
jgi:hypothetical protein